MKQYEKKFDAQGRAYLETSLPGLMLTRLPLLNKGTNFTREEREEFGLLGLLPPRISSMEEQLERHYSNFRKLTDDLERHVFLRAMQDRSEVLFYALLERHLEEMMPLIYTPVVAQAVQQFSRIYRYPRGLVVSPENIDHLDDLLENIAFPDVELVVATDNEGILGIGDQGVGGLAICIGKLSLYTLAAGIDPAVTLPVGLDVGTNRQDLIDDPIYLGVRRPRMEGEEYARFIDKFVAGFTRRFPRALVQWEDFSKQKAFDVLERHRQAAPSFNDDIQGTGAVVLAGLLTAMRRLKQKLREQRFLVHGAGAGGVGVARQIARGLQREGLSEVEARERIFLIDSKGLILSDRKNLEPYKRELAHPPSRAAGWKVAGAIPSLEETIREAKVTTLLGLSGQRGAFDEKVVRAVCANTQTPIVFALSNPTANSEAIPEDVFRWSQGKAAMATGSPFPDVVHDGQRYRIGQGNNAFIFPGVGQAVLATGARKVTDGMLTAAAVALSEYTGGDSIQSGLYPRIDKLRSASRRVALAVIEQARAEGVLGVPVPADLEAFLDARTWKAEYLPIRKRR